ncbi:hypothetical protein [Nocardioides taihuensis]|uniref:Uncharacterized protein n=1 Tax=Nocardioides taihuensis TaxID=1835606 RepID=A0ABW0BR95_9ACTN
MKLVAGPTPPDPVSEAHAAAFEEAWREFTETCAGTVAPEATYQAWLAHFMIQRVGLMHVVREVDFGARHLGEAAAARFRGSNLMVDLLVLREPVVDLPRRAALAQVELPDGAPNPKSGLGRLKDFSVITELKVSATQIEGLDYTEVVRDFEKLSAILNAAEQQYPGAPLPLAFVGIFNNRSKPRFNFEHLHRRLSQVPPHPRVGMLRFDLPGST